MSRFLWRAGDWRELDMTAPLPPRRTPYISRDIGAYRSVVTGEMIDGRTAHRDHLRAHGCVEVGNDFVEPHRAELPPLVDDIQAAIQASPETHAEARAAAERAAQAEIPVA